MIRLSVKDIAGVQCGTEREGLLLYKSLAPLLIVADAIELDFDGVELASSSFFNASIGCAFTEFGEKYVRDSISYVGVNPRVWFVLDRTLSSYAEAV